MSADTPRTDERSFWEKVTALQEERDEWRAQWEYVTAELAKALAEVEQLRAALDQVHDALTASMAEADRLKDAARVAAGRVGIYLEGTPGNDAYRILTRALTTQEDRPAP